MSSKHTFFFWLWAIFLALGCGVVCAEVSGEDLAGIRELRTWTDADGKSLQARMVDFNRRTITFETEAGRTIRLAPTRLSDADKELLRAWLKAGRPGEEEPAAAAGGGIPSGPFVWRSMHRGNTNPRVKYVGFNNEENAHQYETDHFDLFIDEKISDITVQRCVAVFDCIVGATHALPVGLNTIPADGRPRYRTWLVASGRTYQQLGGIPMSGGFFDPKRNLTVIPFSSMGISRNSNDRYVFDGDRRDFSTLIHELVHHCTAHWNFPTWFSEGLSDYMGAMPYRSGSFNFGNPPSYVGANLRGLYEDTILERQLLPDNTFQAARLEHMFGLDRINWNMTLVRHDRLNGARQYSTAMVMVAYFFHLDGRGDGAGVIQYLHALKAALEDGSAAHPQDMALVEQYLLRGRSLEEVEQDMVKKFKSKGLKLEFVR